MELKRRCLLLFLSLFFIGTFAKVNDAGAITADTTEIRTLLADASHQVVTAAAAAEEMLNKALELSQKGNYPMGIVKAYINLGILYQNKGRFPEALDYKIKALKICEKTGDMLHTGNCYFEIGVVYMHNNDFKTYLKYDSLALVCYQKINNQERISDIYNDFGNYYAQNKDAEKAFFYFTKFLDAKEKMKDTTGIYLGYTNLSLYYSEIANDLTKAISYQEKALVLKDHLGDEYKDVISDGYYNLGTAYLKLHKNTQAIEAFKAEMEIAGKIGYKEGLSYAYGGLSEGYEAEKDFSKALYFHKLLSVVTDTIRSKEQRSQFEETAGKYEAEKKQNEINLLNTKQQAAHKQRMYLYAGLGLAVLLLIAFAYGYKNKQKYSKYLEKEGDRKAVLLKEIHHRINNNLQIISSLLSLQAKDSGNKLVKEIIEESQSRIRSLSLLHDNLFTGSTPENIKMNEYLTELTSFYGQALLLEKKKVHIQLAFEPIELPSKKAVPLGLIVNELVTNSYKYAFDENSEKGEIKITLRSLDKNTFELLVSDNGKGESEKAGTGFGLKLIRALVAQIDGEISMNNTNGRSYTVIFKNEEQNS